MTDDTRPPDRFPAGPDLRRADDDVPTTWDFRVEHIARTWAEESDRKKPQRPEVRARIAERIAAGGFGSARPGGFDEPGAGGFGSTRAGGLGEPDSGGFGEPGSGGFGEPGALRILELGCGPGYLAEAILDEVPSAAYTLLDFAPPFLAMARERVERFPGARFVLADFVDPAWTAGLGPFDVIVTMQAVHELRHKRRAPTLYAQAHELLVPGGLLIVCDSEPQNEHPLAMTVAEQQAALASAGFVDIDVLAHIDRLYVVCASRTR